MQVFVYLLHCIFHRLAALIGHCTLDNNNCVPNSNVFTISFSFIIQIFFNFSADRQMTAIGIIVILSFFLFCLLLFLPVCFSLLFSPDSHRHEQGNPTNSQTALFCLRLFTLTNNYIQICIRSFLLTEKSIDL